MIRVEDLMEAIAECEGVRNPSASTCIKLAAFYTILNQMTGENGKNDKRVDVGYSYATADEVPTTGSRFTELLSEKGVKKCIPVLDEGMNVLMVVNTKLYNNIIRKIEEI